MKPMVWSALQVSSDIIILKLGSDFTLLQFFPPPPQLKPQNTQPDKII